MKRFVQGEDRTQGKLLPELLDDYVGENNSVRVIDVFVDNLDLGVCWALLALNWMSPAAFVPSVGAPEDLHIRLSEPHSI